MQVVEGLLISPDSQHSLVLFHTRGRQGEVKYGAAAHSLTTGKRLSTLAQDSRESCSAQFSPCSRRLSLATYSGPFDGMACSLSVFETATWQPISARCTPEAAAALGCHGLDWRCGGVFAPDGRLFLYKGFAKLGLPGNCAVLVEFGCMYVLDAVQGRLVAALPHIGLLHASQGGLTQAGWHPSSTGLVSTACSWQMTGGHAAVLRTAGFAVGQLQTPFSVCLDQALEEGSRFSPDGSLLLVHNTQTGHHAVLGCAMAGKELVFEPLHEVGPLQLLRTVRWHAMTGGVGGLGELGEPAGVLGGCLLLLEDRRGACRLTTPSGVPVGQGWEQTGLASAHAVSPSGTFCIGRQQGSCLDSWAWVLVHCLSGQVAPLARERLGRCYWTPAGNCLVVLHKLCQPYRKGSEPGSGPFTTLRYDAVMGPAAVQVA